MSQGEPDVALKLLHTADWHLGMRFPSFSEEHQRTLMRARMDVLDNVLGAAESADGEGGSILGVEEAEVGEK